MNQVYAPGCALKIYKPHLVPKILKDLEIAHEHQTCCQHEPKLDPGTVVINTCPGCDRRYRELYRGISTISLWEVLAESKTFAFPSYKGKEMTIHDACPTRNEERVHLAVRRLLEKMNIKVVEAKTSRTKAFCCGDSFYGTLSKEQVIEQMKKRAESMPCQDVVVYCISCIKSMYNGGKRPRHIIDLLYGEKTAIGISDPEAWHNELQEFIDAH